MDAHDIVAGEITYDTATDCYRVRHDFGRDRSIDATVAAAVAAVVDAAGTVSIRPLADHQQ